MKKLMSVEELKHYCLFSASPETDFEACFLEQFRFSRPCKLKYEKPGSSLFSFFRDKTKLAEEVVFAGKAVLFQDGFNKPEELIEWIEGLDPSHNAVFDVNDLTPQVIPGFPEDEYGAVSELVENQIDSYAPKSMHPDATDMERFDIAYGKFFEENLDFGRHINAEYDTERCEWASFYHEFDDPSRYHFEQFQVLIDGEEIPRPLHKSISIAGNFHRDGSFIAQGMVRKSLQQMMLVVRTEDELISAPIEKEFRRSIYDLKITLEEP